MNVNSHSLPKDTGRAHSFGRCAAERIESTWVVLLASVCLWAALAFQGCAGGPTNHYNQGVEYHESGRSDEAAGEYKRAIELAPLDPRPRFNLAVLYQDQGRLEEAARLYQEVLSSHPTYAPAWANLAAIREKQEDLPAAEDAYRRAGEADPDDPFVVSQYGFFLLRRHRPAEAESAFKRALERDPRCANAYFGLGRLALDRGEDHGALLAFKNVLRYNPNDRAAHLEASSILKRGGKPAEALGHLRKASNIEPRQPEPFFLLGCLLKDQGSWKEAEKAFEEALSLGAPKVDCYRELDTVYRNLAQEAGTAAQNGPR